MSTDVIEVVAEKPLFNLLAKILQVKIVDGKPVFRDGHIVLIDDHEAEYLLKVKVK